MHHFLKTFCQRANEYGWDNDVTEVLMIPDDHQDPDSELRYLPTHYGEISLEAITRFEKSYLGSAQRSAQDSYMIHKCLMNSLSKEGKMKVESWESEYLVTNDEGTMVPSGNLLLKVIIRESHLDTNATTQSICMKLSNLDEYIVKIESNITKFNGYVKLLVNNLAARGQRTEDLLTHLFKGYQAASDKVFVRYINEDGEVRGRRRYPFRYPDAASGQQVPPHEREENLGCSIGRRGEDFSSPGRGGKVEETQTKAR